MKLSDLQKLTLGLIILWAALLFPETAKSALEYKVHNHKLGGLICHQDRNS